MTRGALIQTRLGRLVRQKLANDLAALVLAAVAMIAIGAVTIAALFWSGWLLLAIAVPAALLGWFWLRGNGFVRAAYQVEERFPEVRGKLVSAYELAQYNPKSREGYSMEMLDAAVQQAEHALAPLPLGRLIRRRRLLWSGAALVASLLVFFLFGALLGARARAGLANAFSPSALKVGFEVEPGDTSVMPNGVVALRCRVEPAGAFREVRLERAGKRRDARTVKLQSDTCRIVLAVEDGFKYRFRVLSRRSEEHGVRVLRPLGLNRLVFTYHYPEYSGLKESRTTSTDLSALKGTVVDVEGEANQLVGRGRLVVGPDTFGLHLDSADLRRFTGRFTVKGDAEGAIELAEREGSRDERDGGRSQKGEGGGQNEDQVRSPGGEAMLAAAMLSVRALTDEPPFVKLFLPGRDVDMPMSMQVLLGINSLDDFGLGELYLHYGKDSVDHRIRLKGLTGRREDTTLYSWDLSDAGLLSGEQLRYYVSVTDNDAVSGSKTGRTDVFSVRFPTMAEIYSASVRQTERTASELGPMQSEQAQIGTDLNRVADELKKSRELSWEEKKALDQVLSSQEGLVQQIAELRQEAAQMMEELSQGMTLDQETMQRMGQLQDLLSDLLPRELQQSLAQLRDKLQQQSPDVRRALGKFQIDQDKLRQSIERALELLKKIAEEQRLEALARKADELAEAQKRLTDQLGREPSEQSAQMQQDIKEALDSLKKEMQSLGDSMSDKAIGDSLSQLSGQMDQEQLSQIAEQLAQQMRQGKTSESRAKSGKLGQSMKKLAESLKSLSQQLKKKRSAEVAGKLAAAAGDVLMLSDEQEELEGSTAGKPDLSLEAQRQMGLHDAARIVAESLASLAGQSMSVSPQIAQELARAMSDMQDAAQGMVDNNIGHTRQGMDDARQGLNRTVEALLDALARAQQGGGMSGDMESLMEALSKMTADQMSLNSEMGGMPIPIPGGLTEAQMQALGRMLAKQRAIREALQQMLQNAGGTEPGLTSSLEGLIEEMTDVERDLSELNVTRDVVERQESILSHLLDAQRSIRQQGFKEERESESGKAFEIQQRPRLPADMGERNRLLREELMRALKAGYPPEYERMIRAYFERLLNQP